MAFLEYISCASNRLWLVRRTKPDKNDWNFYLLAAAASGRFLEPLITRQLPASEAIVCGQDACNFCSHETALNGLLFRRGCSASNKDVPKGIVVRPILDFIYQFGCA